MASENVIEVTETNWAEEVTNSKIPVLVDFWATWCSPCKALIPVLDALAIELNGRVKIVSVDVENNIQLATDYNIRSIPALMVFVGGDKMPDKLVGAVNKEAIKKILEKYIEKGDRDEKR